MIHAASPTTQTTLTNIDKECVQQNAVDLRLKSIRHIKPTLFVIDEDNKTHRETEPVELGEDGYWYLEPGTYEITTDHIITMGNSEAGFVITRSTLNRNGVFITSGNYDSGYNGSMAGCLHVEGGPMKIKPGTRVGQMLLWKAEALSQYNGDYGLDENGKPKMMEVKYHG
jgi:deoxycytidine triphosphate deaminase